MTSLRGQTRARDQRFQNLGSKQNEKCPALVEVCDEKQAAEYLTQWNVRGM